MILGKLPKSKLCIKSYEPVCELPVCKCTWEKCLRKDYFEKMDNKQSDNG